MRETTTIPIGQPSSQPLVEVAEPGGGRRPPVVLTRAGLTVGRVPGNDILLEEGTVSSHHARIDWDGARVTVTDLGARNGTMLGRRRLTPQAPEVWTPTNWLAIGPFWIRLQMPEAAPPPAGPRDEAPAQPAGRATEVSDPTKRVFVQADPDALTITAGQPYSVNILLANLGRTVDHYHVTVEGVPAGWVSAPARDVQLNPGMHATTTLQITVPRTEATRPGEYNAILRATSKADATITGAVPARWTVLPFELPIRSGPASTPAPTPAPVPYAVKVIVAGRVGIQPPRAAGRTRATYRVTIQNDGSEPATFQLQGNDGRRLLRYEFEPPSFTLTPGMNATARLRVQARRRWFGRARTIPFVVEAAQPDIPPHTVGAIFRRKAMIHGFLQLLLLLTIVGAGVGAYLTYGSPAGW